MDLDTNAQRPVLKGTKMDYPIEIMENPKDAVAFADQNAVAYAAAAGGMGDLTYQWQISRDNGESWKNLSGQTDTKLDFAASLRYDGALLRCEVTDTVGTKVYTGRQICGSTTRMSRQRTLQRSCTRTMRKTA